MQINKITVLPIMLTKKKQTLSSFDDLTFLYRRFMKLIAILQFDGHDYDCLTTRLLLTYFFTMSLIAWTNYVSYLLNGVTYYLHSYVQKNGNPNEIAFAKGTVTIEMICEMVIVMGYQYRYYILLWHRREFSSILDDCRRIWQELCSVDEDACLAIHHFERKVHLLFYWLFGSFSFSIVAYFAAALSQTLEATARNGNDTQEKKYHLPFVWFVEDSENSWPGYKFHYTMELIVGVSSNLIATAVDAAAPLLIMIGAGYFRALRLRLCRLYDEILEDDNDSVIVDARQLVDCLRLHQSILCYCSRIDNITRNLFLVQLMTTTYNISLAGIKLAGTEPDKYKYVSMGMLSVGQLFICHWTPDHLLDDSLSISTAAYSVFIPGMSSRTGKLLRLLITRVQQPVQMTAAGYVHLGLQKFGEMLRGAFSFFMVLRNFTV